MFKMEFTEKEINVILQALGNQPYISVAELITNIHKQAGEQIENNSTDSGEIEE